MSAYGPSPARASGPLLSPKQFPLADAQLTVFHLSISSIPSLLADYLYETFQAELARGTSYPQEFPMTRPAFDAYFLGNDIFVGIIDAAGSLTIDTASAGREWDVCIGGVYYVKPNYPGRSSHICNAGFLVPPRMRGLGIATVLAQSYVQNAPLLGYRGSVFNLVYVDNEASVRIWDRLGFTKIGPIPGAGKINRKTDDGADVEEYVDAWIVYKSFVAEEGC